MAILWQDGNFATASAIDSPVLSSPIVGVKTRYVLTQNYMQFLANFSPLSLGLADAPVAHPDYTSFYCVGESQTDALGGGVCRFQRTYAKVPDQHITYENFAYNFIGFYGQFGINITAISGRARFTRIVQSQLVHDYFLIGTGQTYTTPGAIPFTQMQRYYDLTFTNFETDYLADANPQTVPTLTTYQAWIADAVANGWLAASGGKIIAEPTQISQWMGNIWHRQTRYILAQ